MGVGGYIDECSGSKLLCSMLKCVQGRVRDTHPADGMEYEY